MAPRCSAAVADTQWLAWCHGVTGSVTGGVAVCSGPAGRVVRALLRWVWNVSVSSVSRSSVGTLRCWLVPSVSSMP